MDLQAKKRTLRILVTNKCNLSCDYCNYEGNKSEYTLLNYSNYISAIHDMKRHYGIERVKISGGEPFEREDIATIIRKVKLTCDRERLEFGLITNGTHTDRIVSVFEMPDMKNTDLTVSIPTIDSKVFSDITRAETGCGHVKDTIQQCRRLLPSVKINVVLYGDNALPKAVDNMICFAKELKLNLRFLGVIVNGYNYSKIDKSRMVSYEQFKDLLKERHFFVREEKVDRSVFIDSHGFVITYIKPFCTQDCEKCPKDRTSIWLCQDGTYKLCVYGPKHDLYWERVDVLKASAR